MKGKIFSIVAGQYLINDENNNLITLPAAGKLRHMKVVPLVGDNVEFENGMLQEVYPRENEFVRPKVANIDQMIVCMSIKEPNFQPYLIDKYLAIIEGKNIKPILFFTKSDLDELESHKWFTYYKSMNYDVYLINNNNDEVKKLKGLLKDKYSVFMGQSGVGKTTTLNNLSNSNYQTQSISKALGRGKHTTRVVQIIPFNEGYLVDTPGFSSLNLDMDAFALSRSFNLFKKYAPMCKYRSCLHINEKLQDCAIKQKVEESIITMLRYENYLKMQNELKEKVK